MIRRRKTLQPQRVSNSLLLLSPDHISALASMSLQGLVSGSECAVPFNPLSQVLKHTEGDRSVQQVRLESN